MTRFSVFMKIIHSFDLLRTPIQNDPDASVVTPITSPLTIFMYPELERDFADFLTEFGSRNERISTTRDPHSVQVKKKLQNYCVDLPTALLYEVPASTNSEPMLHKIRASNEDMPDVKDIVFTGIKINIDDYCDIIPMFPCFEDLEGTLFYITHGFNEDYMFVFKHESRSSYPTLYGLVERTPILSGSFRNQRHLERHFLQMHRLAEPKPNDSNPICTLNNMQKFRLCSLVENSKESVQLERPWSLGKGKPWSLGKEIRVNRTQELKCDENELVSFQELDENNPTYKNAMVVTTVLPCFTTEYERSEVIFLISEDPKDKNSIYLLERLEYGERYRGEKKRANSITFVRGHVRDIPLLKHADTFF